MQVELAKGGARRGARGGGYGGGYGGGISRRSQFRVRVTGLPRSCSWQDLKDFMRKSGDVTFANVSTSDSLGGGGGYAASCYDALLKCKNSMQTEVSHTPLFADVRPTVSVKCPPHTAH